MKTITLTAIFFALIVLDALVAAQENQPLQQALQQGLLAENRNPRFYKQLLEQLEHREALAATALFRLAESHRKLNQHEQAIAAYQSLIKQFPGRENLIRQAEVQLAALGIDVAVADRGTPSAQVQQIERIIKESPDLLNDPSRGLLHAAVYNNQWPEARYLIESGARVDLIAQLHPRDLHPELKPKRQLSSEKTVAWYEEKDAAFTPIMVAVRQGHLSMVRLLMTHGARPDADTWAMATALNRASIIGHFFDAIKQIPAADLLPAVEVAVQDDAPVLLKRLLSRIGPDPKLFHTLLLQATSDAVFQHLLDAGAVPKAEHLAAAISRHQLLIASAHTMVGMGLWHASAGEAAIRHHPEFIPTALRNFPAAGNRTAQDIHLLGVATLCTRPEAIRILLDKGAGLEFDAAVFSGNPQFNSLLALLLHWGHWRQSPDKRKEDLLQCTDLVLGCVPTNPGAASEYYSTLLYFIGTALPQPSPVLYPVLKKILAVHPAVTPAEADKLLGMLPDNLSRDPTISTLQIYLAKQTSPVLHAVTTVFRDGKISEGIQHSRAPVRLSILLQPLLGTFSPELVEVYAPGKWQPEVINCNDGLAGDNRGSDPVVGPGSLIVLSPTEENPPEDLTTWFERSATRTISVRYGSNAWKRIALPSRAEDFCYDPELGSVPGRTLAEILKELHLPPALEQGQVTLLRSLDGDKRRVRWLSGRDELILDGDQIMLENLDIDSDRFPSLPDDAIWLTRQSQLFAFPLCPRDQLQVPSNGATSVDLAEFVAIAYASPTVVLSSPDLRRLRLIRGRDEQTIDFLSLKPGHIPVLFPGDVVEIPATQPPAKHWTGLDNAVQHHLDALLDRDVTLEFKTCPPRTNAVRLLPPRWRFPRQGNQRRALPNELISNQVYRTLSATDILVHTCRQVDEHHVGGALIESATGRRSVGWLGTEAKNNHRALPLIEPGDRLYLWPFGQYILGDQPRYVELGYDGPRHVVYLLFFYPEERAAAFKKLTSGITSTLTGAYETVADYEGGGTTMLKNAKITSLLYSGKSPKDAFTYASDYRKMVLERMQAARLDWTLTISEPTSMAHPIWVFPSETAPKQP